MAEIVYLALGSNAPNANEYLNKACALIIEKCARENTFKESSRLKNPPVGFESNHDFFNSACELITELSPFELLQKLEAIEIELGRETKSNGSYSDRVIDIDIILYGKEQIHDEKLIIPHPRFRERDFVLRPLLGLKPKLLDPKTQLNINQLLKLIKE